MLVTKYKVGTERGPVTLPRPPTCPGAAHSGTISFVSVLLSAETLGFVLLVAPLEAGRMLFQAITWVIDDDTHVG